MSRVRWAGTCNQCGACCAPWDPQTGRRLHCENLEVWGPVGTPHATRCRVYGTRFDGMPVRLVDAETGIWGGRSTCQKDSAAEDEAIVLYGQGRGCSLTQGEASDGAA